VSGTQAGEIYFSGGSAAYGSNPFILSSGVLGPLPGNAYYSLTSATTFKVFARETINSTTTSGSFYISAADSTAHRTGYLVVEVCYIQPDVAPGYEDIDMYLTGRVVS
jgi:hypothetical protein